MSASGKYVGLTLAIVSAFLTGASFVLTKYGLIQASRRNRSTNFLIRRGWGKSRVLKEHNLVGWNGSKYFKINIVVIGEAANFAAYTFAPAILVTPLGALSVLIGYIFSNQNNPCCCFSKGTITKGRIHWL